MDVHYDRNWRRTGQTVKHGAFSFVVSFLFGFVLIVGLVGWPLTFVPEPFTWPVAIVWWVVLVLAFAGRKMRRR